MNKAYPLARWKTGLKYLIICRKPGVYCMQIICIPKDTLYYNCLLSFITSYLKPYLCILLFDKQKNKVWLVEKHLLVTWNNVTGKQLFIEKSNLKETMIIIQI